MEIEYGCIKIWYNNVEKFAYFRSTDSTLFMVPGQVIHIIAESDLGLLIIGSIKSREFLPAIIQVGVQLQREINFTVMDKDEYASRLINYGYIIYSIHGDTKTWFTGDVDGVGQVSNLKANELLETAGEHQKNYQLG